MELWGGRFSAAPSEIALNFGASIDVDRRLYRQDILGSAAHCRMLGREGILSTEDVEALLGGLRQVLDEIESGQFSFRLDREDIHANVEGRLRDLIGDVAGRLHTGRSRNDQVALDVRLWTREAIVLLVERLADVRSALLEQARAHADLPVPGYTHLQRAQPVLLSHHLHAYVEMLGRDAARLRDSYARVDVLPLGSGALAGVPYSIDRDSVARELGFTSVSANSMDAVSDRDFALEVLSACAIAAVHLSRLAEEIVLWSTTEFGFLQLSDDFSTGSSIMPQKKNPDPAELIRGKSGRVVGQLVTLLTIVKGTPLTYNKDMQEDKPALFDGVDALVACLTVLAPMLRAATFQREALSRAAGENFVLATDYADHLAARGVPFRRAHEIVGRIVANCISADRRLEDLSLDELRTFAPEFGPSVENITVLTSIEARDVVGGTARRRVEAALMVASASVENDREWCAEIRTRLPNVERLLTPESASETR